MAFTVSVDELVALLAPGIVITDPDICDTYRQDRALDPDARTPLAVVRARSTDDVATAVRWCANHRVPIIPRGAGTGLSGGSSAAADAIVISTAAMRDISVDATMRVAVVQPGLLNAEVKAAVAEHGLWYPPDPSSFEICSIGGNAATNAGGLCCVKYGVTTDYVLGMEVVLADGRVIRLGGPRLKDTAGLSLTKLFVGSEGTLGIITELTLRLLPPQPAAATLVGSFESVESATQAVLEITNQIRPAMLEFMDAVAIGAVEDHMNMGLDRSAGAMLVAQSDAPGAAAAAEIEIMTTAFTKYGATEVFATDDPAEGEMFTTARRMAIPAVETLGTLLLEDVGVPLPALPALVGGIAEIASNRDVMISVIAHAGDGNTHPLIVFDPTDAAHSDRAQLAFGEIMDLAISLGGTITGEHGVGRLKRPWLAGQLGDDVLDVSRRIKTALDPDGILNPGALL